MQYHVKMPRLALNTDVEKGHCQASKETIDANIICSCLGRVVNQGRVML